jgi:cytochrome b6-f complex iron-sulfur subunit
MANVALALAGALGFGLFAERLLAFLYPIVPPEEQVELAVAREDAIPVGGGTVVHLPYGHVALENANGEIRAFSAVCTHLGCIIKWQPASDHTWFCPCHKGKYDREGKVVAGPPPRPLARLPVSVRDGTVYVKMKIRREAPVA